MNEYNWDDIITNPSSEKAKNCIGKRVYYSDFPKSCLISVNSNDGDSLGILIEVNEEDSLPFKIQVKKDNLYCFRKFPCIIPIEDEPNRYVPFESADEFIDAYEKSFKTIEPDSTEHILHRNWGIWIKYIDRDTFSYQQVTKIWNNGLIIGCDTEIISWKDIKDKYTFLDGTPCGKLREEK